MDEKKDKLDLLLNKYFNAKKEKMLEDHMSVNEPSAMYEAASCDEESAIEALREAPEPCPSQDVMLSYLDGTMGADNKGVFEKHMKHCRNCGNLIRYGKKLLSVHADGKLTSPPEDLSKEIVSKLSELYLKAKSRKK